MKNIITVLEERKTKLEEIANSNCPIDPKLAKSHDERVKKASAYVKELNGLIPFLPSDSKIYVVHINTLERKMETADFATIEDEGIFFKLVHISNFPEEDMYLIYLAPLSSI